jgi:octaprenyl-diphosphate synthase
MVVGVGNLAILKVLSDATNLIAEGEVLQLINCHDPETTEERYMNVIHYKTAKMFEAAAQSGAILANPDRLTEMAFAHYADHLGRAFQLVDDVLDYTGTAEEMGKNVGDDLAEGKPTLPLIHAIRHGTPEEAGMISKAIRTGGLDHLEAITQVVRRTGALDYTMDKAIEQASLAKKALDEIPASHYKDALISLADLSVQRNH